MSKIKVGDYYYDPEAKDIIKIIKIVDKVCYFDLIDDPNDSFNDTDRRTWNKGTILECYIKLPYYNTPLWKAMNG